MAKLEYSDGVTWEIEGGVDFNLEDILFLNLKHAIDALAVAIPLSSLSVTKVSDVYQYRWSSGSNTFGIDYKKVGGVWQQRFLLSSYFLTEHIGLQRPVTTNLVPFIDKYQVTKVEFSW